MAYYASIWAKGQLRQPSDLFQPWSFAHLLKMSFTLPRYWGWHPKIPWSTFKSLKVHRFLEVFLFHSSCVVMILQTSRAPFQGSWGGGGHAGKNFSLDFHALETSFGISPEIDEIAQSNDMLLTKSYMFLHNPPPPPPCTNPKECCRGQWKPVINPTAILPPPPPNLHTSWAAKTRQVGGTLKPF